MKKVVRIVLAQLKAELGDKQSNLRNVINVIKERADASSPTLIVFPELYLSGYYCKDEVLELAETVPGPSTMLIAKTLAEMSARRTVVIVGLPELSKQEKLVYNSAAVIGCGEIIGCYRKRHLPSYRVFEEARYFKAAWGAIRVFNTPVGVIGVNICYDFFFPEVTRCQVLRGADIIVNISAAPDMSRKFFETFSLARALENTVFVIYVNNVGFYDGLGFFGGSRVVSPLGTVIAQAKYYEEDIVSVDIDLEELKRCRKIRPILKDVNPLDLVEMGRLVEELREKI